MRVARFYVTRELLAQILCLPPGAQILAVGAASNPDVLQYAEFIVEHDSLAPVSVNQAIPLVRPTFTKNNDGEVCFVGWGQ